MVVVICGGCDSYNSCLFFYCKFSAMFIFAAVDYAMEYIGVFVRELVVFKKKMFTLLCVCLECDCVSVCMHK